MKKELIVIGNTSVRMTTVPVHVIFDGIYDNVDSPSELLGDRFQIIESDGVYIVMHESFSEQEPYEQKFKAFTTQEDAFTYLSLFGIEEDDETCPDNEHF